MSAAVVGGDARAGDVVAGAGDADGARCRGWGHERWASVRTALAADMERFVEHDPTGSASGLKKRLSIFLQPSILCLGTYRVAHWLWVRGWRWLPRALTRLNQLVHKVDIPHDACVGPGCFLGHTVGTCFVGSAGRDLTLYFLAVCCPLEERIGDAAGAGPRLGDGVTIGAMATVLGGVEVGDGVQLAPRTRVAAPTPPGSLVISRIMRPRARPLPGAGAGSEQQRPVADAPHEEGSQRGEVARQVEDGAQQA